MYFVPIPALTAQQIDHFRSQYRESDGCWQWEAGITPNGYGKAWFSGKTLTAHRVAYTTFVGAIPAGLVIDHLCRNRACVRPDHLEAVTPAENVHRGDIGGLVAGQPCSHGHVLTDAVLGVLKSGNLVCRLCDHARVAKYRLRLATRRANENDNQSLVA